MSSRMVGITIVTCVATLAQLCEAPINNTAIASEQDRVLRVYLPRNVITKDDLVTLGQVSIIRGVESLVAKASQIPLGRISVPGQKIVMDRAVVLSRLACSGIPLSKVTLTGAEEITVTQEQQIIAGAKFVELASSFLTENPPAHSVCQSIPMRTPEDLILPGPGKHIELSPRLVESTAPNQGTVQIIVLADGKAIGTREVTLRLKYNCRTVVTLTEIPVGGVISAENVKITEAVSNYPEPANWSPPYGLIAKRRLPANTVIRPDMVARHTDERAAIVVRRNETVVIRIERPGFLITAMGIALKEARPGECVKVRNADSQRIILCKVNEDGTVEPTL
jgi:flagella basal body P-ring formation protein FlgA